MTSVSLFQILPAHVIRTIVDCISGSSRLYYDGVEKGSNEYQRLQLPLLRVCRNFRAIVYLNFCSICRITLQGPLCGIRVKWNTWPPQLLNRPDTSVFHLAKKIDITLTMWSVCSGDAAKLLSSTHYKSGAFPRVRLIRFQVDPSKEPQIELAQLSKDASANIGAFVQRIRQMAPRNDENMAVFMPGPHAMPSCFKKHVSDLLFQLYQTNTRTVHQYLDQLSFSGLSSESLPNLAFLSIIVKDDIRHFVHLARLNAPTLQLLSIKSFADFEITDLIQDGNGGDARYPCLHTLWHVVFLSLETPRLPTFHGAVPFPSLRRLSFFSRYPFGDDTPFRGNAATLETLKSG
ncbi:hypothetical protein IWW47_003233 [Coemansia sp. RSA 2052]|nr:hypothetical protein IWW47_003233 [Coemansia sp. RSA 2052]